MKKDRSRLEIKQSFRKILRISFLLLVREFYFFLANLYGLVCHPFLTFKTIKKEKDRSQEFLIFGLPGYLWLAAVIFLAGLRFLMGIRGNLGWIAKTSLLTVTMIALLLLGYLSYWFFRTFKAFPENKK